MRTYDITLSITPGMPVWPGDPPVTLERVSKIEDGANANVSRLDMGVHTGTHIDAPYHFLKDGGTAEQLSLKTLMGRAYVVHLPDSVDTITADVLKNADIPPRTRRLLFRTRNSKWWANDHSSFEKGFVGIDESGAETLVQRGARLVGVDYLSVAPFGNSAPTHKVLLEAGIIVVEGLNLSEVEQGRYNFYCLPLKLVNSDGAPARAVLVGV